MNKRMIFIQPLKGVAVRTPRTNAIIPIDGAWVMEDNYWLRRINDGSVRVIEPPIAPKLEDKEKYDKEKEDKRR